MAGGFCVRWTTWRVLLHPFKARKQIEEANGMQDDLSKRLEEALEMLEKQRKECARITMDNVEMSRRLSECEFELSRTRSELATTKRKLAEAEDQLAEHKSVDEKIAEFNKELTKAEAMKHSYEKRIAELESRLGDAKSRLSQADDRELLDSIDMTAPAPRYRRSALTPARTAPSAARPAASGRSSATTPSRSSATSRSGAARPVPTSGFLGPSSTSTPQPARAQSVPTQIPDSQETKAEPEEIFDPSDPATVISIPKTSPAASKPEAASRTTSVKEELASKLPLRRNPKTSANSQDNDWLLTPPDF